MKLSILDQSPISSGQTASMALHDSLLLAQEADKLGYSRIWFTEHHDLQGLACSSPEVMISYVGAKTRNIKIGAGAVLLPHYEPYRVAETFNMLATLFPGRVDLGIGRAPGGSAEVTMALTDQYLQNVYKMPDLVEELLHFLKRDFPEDHPFSKVSAAPVPETIAEPWILGTSEKSAKLAAENGVAYAFGEFMSQKDGVKSFQLYRDQFQAKGILPSPKTILTVAVICAEDEAKANDIALSNILWRVQSEKGEGKTVPSLQEAKQYVWTEREVGLKEQIKEKIIIGNPLQVKHRLMDLQERYQADEIMLITITHDLQDRLNSFRLIAKELLG